MKILQLSKYYPPTYGGIELVAEFFSRAGIDLGHKMHVISLGKTNKQYTGTYGEKVLESKENINFKSSPVSLSYAQNLKRELLQNTPDWLLVHLPNPFAHELLKFYRTLIQQKKIKVAGIYHSDIVNQVTLRDAYNFYFLRDKDLYDAFFCSSFDLQKSSSILSQVDQQKIKIIPFCIDHQYNQTLQRPTQFQGKFITVGRMVPYKGYEFLIETFKTLPYELTIVGNGPLRTKLEKMAGRNIRFVGAVSEQEKYQLFNQHDALIMSSINRAEAYGMTIVEAFSMGLPVIASDIDTGVSFLVRDGKTGLKFPILDQNALKNKIQQLANSQEFARSVSQTSHQFFQKELSYSAFRNNFSLLLK